MAKTFLLKLRDSTISALPIILVMVILSFIFVPNRLLIYVFIFCAIFLIMGLSLFTMGVDNSMVAIGEGIGSSLSKSKRIWLILLSSCVLGISITFAEPDLGLLATQIGSINKWLFIGVVSVGMGIMLILACLRVIYKIHLSILLACSFLIVVVISFFVPEQFIAVAFDSGAITTGTLSVPLLISLGFGLSAVRTGKNSEDGTFGMIALGSIGPIITIMLLGLFVKDTNIAVVASDGAVAGNFVEFLSIAGFNLLETLRDVAITILPVLIIFFIFQFSSIKYPMKRIWRILVGLLFTYVGIVLFLTATNCGLLPIGKELGRQLGLLDKNWIVISVGVLLGFCMIIAEPAVIVLNNQVASVTHNSISKKMILFSLAIGVALATGLSLIRVVYNINFTYLIAPIYIISIVLSFFNQESFSAIGFDSGGVASGTMSVALILPFVSGFCSALGSVQEGALGTISLIACVPILVIQIMGILYKVANKRHIRKMKLNAQKIKEGTTEKIFIEEFDF